MLACLVVIGAATFAKGIEPGFSMKRNSLQYKDAKIGKGQAIKEGDKLEILYTGWLFKDGKKGKKIGSSVDPKKPFKFTVGKGVIEGWSDGVLGMKAGGKRLVIIPPELAHGKKGKGDIPANATLYYEIQVLKKAD
jgi:FKBP-type peptidyl-prolyl cis-trans isomerase